MRKIDLSSYYYALFSTLCLFFVHTVKVDAVVLTSIRPLAFIAAAVADGVTSVEVLLPPVASPHDYILRPSDLRRLQAAELVIWVGPKLEHFLNQPLRNLKHKHQLALALSTQITPLLRYTQPTKFKHELDVIKTNQNKHYDPHIWLSPTIAKQAARLIKEQLTENYPESAQRLALNLASFEQKITCVEQQILKRLAPVVQQSFFVFHNAYGYFEEYFGLQQAGYFTINPLIQPGIQKLRQIREQLQKKRVNCLFYEPQFKPAVIQAVANSTGAIIGMLDPLGIDIPINKNSYCGFLLQLSEQFFNCLNYNDRGE